MPARTNIHWADYQSNMLYAVLKSDEFREGHACVRVSPGCEHCWASAFNTRLGTGLPYTAQNLKKVEVNLHETELKRITKFKPKPLKGESAFKWGRSRAVVFPCDMTDMFGEWVTDEMLDRMFEAMYYRADVDWMVLTKRPGRAAQYLQAKAQAGKMPLKNIYIGCTVEDRMRADLRVHPMRTIHSLGWNTCVSYEPALSSVDWNDWYFIQWLVCGGESGAAARPMHPDWARGARDFCVRNNIPYFHKQNGEFAPLSALNVTDATTFKHKPINWEGTMLYRVGLGLAGRLLDGREWNQTAR
jgi:protein gp37